MSSSRAVTPLRLDAAWSRVPNHHNIPMELMASPEVPVEPAALRQALELLELQTLLASEPSSGIQRAVLTPDLHRGAGIPVGLAALADGVIPASIGSDIGCGMRLLLLEGVSWEQLAPYAGRLEQRLRAIFFGGQRQLMLSPVQREAMLREGLLGLLETTAPDPQGLWRLYCAQQQELDLERNHLAGSLLSEQVWPGFEAYVRGSGASNSYDAQLGSVGGGNHFVELQEIEEIQDGSTAWEWGLRQGGCAVMVHSGSLGFGGAVAAHYVPVSRQLLGGAPGFLPVEGAQAGHAQQYLLGMRNAANFAFANRLALGLMMVKAIQETLGRELAVRLVGDAPHNLIWEPDQAEAGYLHRKGATPALGVSQSGPFAYTGHPVLIPGSMGAPSYVLAGQGSARALHSASHGAGRALSRGAAARLRDPATDRLRVVGPIDAQQLRAEGRMDLLAEQQRRLAEEAPAAYKPVEPVIESVIAAGAARPVARLRPLLTVKG